LAETGVLRSTTSFAKARRGLKEDVHDIRQAKSGIVEEACIRKSPSAIRDLNSPLSIIFNAKVLSRLTPKAFELPNALLN
jgi:hypothetical protein